MSTLLVVSFADSERTGQAASLIREMHADGSTKLYASTLVACDAQGRLTMQTLTGEGIGGTLVGGLIGGLAGLPAGVAGAIVGAAGGALIGAAADLVNQHSEAELADRVSRRLVPGMAAIAVDVADDGVASFEARMQALGAAIARE
jgi:uncharacterized membrane protein